MQKKIKLFDPLVERRDKLAMLKVLKSKFWASGSGIGYVAKFEENFNKYIGSKQSISLNSGTAALHLALSLFNIKNQEVILPSLSFVSTAHAVLYNGGKPIFVDVDPQTLCIDPEAIKKAISKKTRVILPVHFGGMPSDLDEILNLCKQHDIKLIEDAAHAVGSIYNNKKIGTHGNAVCFSFHPVKNLAMPSGGAITLNNESKNNLQILKAKRWCGITNRKGVKYDVKELGWNYYMNEFSAAIGIEQLKKLDKMNKKRQQIAHRYSKEIELDLKMPFNKNCCYHLYWVLVKNRNYFMKKMNENDIETGIHYFPIHQMTFYKGKNNIPTTERVGKTIVSLPIHQNLDELDINKIIKTTNKFAK